MDLLALAAKLCCWFDCDYLMATSCKFCSVAARARSYVKHRAGLHGEKMQQVAVDLSAGDALVL